MLISCARAATLKLANQKDACAPEAPVLIAAIDDAFTLAGALPIADPALDLGNPMKGPFRALPCDWPHAATAALELARIAGILPAFMVDADHAGEAQAVCSADLPQWSDTGALRIAARATLPVAASDDARIVAFRSADDTREHVALIIGQQTGDRVPLVRLHSECLTGDILGSLKCDCGPQLNASLAAMAQESARGGWGVLLYLRQEGRGIGLVNKLRAYALQDQGFDTVDANRRLGLPDEARDFPVAARMLTLLECAHDPVDDQQSGQGCGVGSGRHHGYRACAASAARQSAQCPLSGDEARPFRAFAPLIRRQCNDRWPAPSARCRPLSIPPSIRYGPVRTAG